MEDKKRRLTYQQRQWIEDAYRSINEDPHSYEFDTLEGNEVEVAELIKEDVEQVFKCKIADEQIINHIKFL